MAKPGDPFETKQLDEQRVRQRRTLRMVDTHVVVETAQQCRFPKVPDEDVGLVEQTLRDLADEDAKMVGEDRLTAMGTVEVGIVMQEHVNALFRPRPERKRFEPNVERLARQYVEDQGKGPDVNDVIEPLVRMVAFLIWADQLAGDDYTDPRVR